jgi:hypothetical protein
MVEMDVMMTTVLAASVAVDASDRIDHHRPLQRLALEIPNLLDSYPVA